MFAAVILLQALAEKQCRQRSVCHICALGMQCCLQGGRFKWLPSCPANHTSFLWNPQMQAKKQARKRKAMEASAAAAAAGSPPKRVSLPGWVARLPGAPVGAAARGTPAAAAAATMSPSCGPASPGGCAQSNQPGAGAHKRRQQVQQEVQQQEQQQGTSSSSLAPTQQQQQQEKQRKGAGKAAGAGGKASSGNKSKQTLLSPAPSRKAGGAAEPSGRKARVATAAGAAAAAGAPSPAKSDRQRSTGSAQDVPDVLRQHESKAVAPEDSGAAPVLLWQEGGGAGRAFGQHLNACPEPSPVDAAGFATALRQGLHGAIKQAAPWVVLECTAMCCTAR